MAAMLGGQHLHIYSSFSPNTQICSSGQKEIEIVDPFICFSRVIFPGDVLQVRESISPAETGHTPHQRHVQEEREGQEQNREQAALLRLCYTENEVPPRKLFDFLKQKYFFTRNKNIVKQKHFMGKSSLS